MSSCVAQVLERARHAMGNSCCSLVDAAKAAEELAQKNWRLDRRINGDWQESKFHVDFRITYLIEKNENNQIENLNEIYLGIDAFTS